MRSKEKIILIDENKYPNFNLYIDQVLQFMTINYPSIPVSKSLIKNYVKDGILFPPIKRKYTKEHLILIVLASILSKSLEPDKLKSFLSPLAEKCEKGSPKDLHLIYNELYLISPDILSIQDKMTDQVTRLSEKNLINVLSVSLLKSFIDADIK